MKSKLLVIATTALLFTACSDSFLDRAPEGNYVDATFYTSDEALEAATAPLYNRAWFDYNQRSIVPIGSGRANEYVQSLELSAVCYFPSDSFG